MYGELFFFFTRGDEIEERTYTYIHNKHTNYSVIRIVLLSGYQKLALLYVLLCSFKHSHLCSEEVYM